MVPTLICETSCRHRMQRKSVAIMINTPVHSQNPNKSLLFRGSWTLHRSGRGMYNIIRSVLDNCEIYGRRL
jgi:hypothetical protein